MENVIKQEKFAFFLFFVIEKGENDIQYQQGFG
jgi:hypothetical protein